jgi:predicted deacylase
MHGTEMTGTEVIRRLLREVLTPAELRANIVAVPILSPLAYQAQLMNTPQDGYNLNRVFPGKPKMFLSHRLAHLIFHGLLRPCDCVIDPNANSSPAVQFAIVKGTVDQTIKDRSRELRMRLA